jgi:hypothetical protein
MHKPCTSTSKRALAPVSPARRADRSSGNGRPDLRRAMVVAKGFDVATR